MSGPARVAITGLGTAARRAHLPALAAAAQRGTASLVGVFDPDTGRRDEVAGEHPEAVAYPSVEAMLDGSGCDLLAIASPPSAHLDAIVAAAEREVDVLCEKPLGVGTEDADRLRDLAGRHPRLLVATVHQYAYAAAWQPFVSTLREAVCTGRPFTLRVEVERPGTDPLSSGGWRAAGDREGGILGDHAVHYLALCHHVDAGARVLECSRTGEPGREAAEVDLAIGPGRATVVVTYAGGRRRNLVEASVPATGRRLRWEDGVLDEDGVIRAVAALSDRATVNDLYRDLYDDLLANRRDPAWEAERTAETLDVAALLHAAMEAAHIRV